MPITPGEWKVEDRKTEGTEYGVTQGLSKDLYPLVINAPCQLSVLGQAIAIIPWDSVSGLDKDNANLIAASPLLLHALDQLLAQYLFESQIADSPLIRRCKEALEKAEGRKE